MESYVAYLIISLAVVFVLSSFFLSFSAPEQKTARQVCNMGNNSVIDGLSAVSLMETRGCDGYAFTLDGDYDLKSLAELAGIVAFEIGTCNHTALSESAGVYIEAGIKRRFVVYDFGRARLFCRVK